MKEKGKLLIAEQLNIRGQLKITLHNPSAIGELDDASQNRILDQIRKVDGTISKLEEILNRL